MLQQTLARGKLWCCGRSRMWLAQGPSPSREDRRKKHADGGTVQNKSGKSAAQRLRKYKLYRSTTDLPSKSCSEEEERCRVKKNVNSKTHSLRVAYVCCHHPTAVVQIIPATFSARRKVCTTCTRFRKNLKTKSSNE